PTQGLALAGQLGRNVQHGLRAINPSNDLTTPPQQAQPKDPVEKPDRPAATLRPHSQTGPESHSPTRKNFGGGSRLSLRCGAGRPRPATRPRPHIVSSP